MSAGKSFKFHGSTIAIMTGFSTASPNPQITAITKANPAVVTSAGHGRSNGDAVKLSGIVGMTELNDDLFVVQNKTTDTFELAGVNSTGYGAWSSGGVIDVAEFSNFCELTNYNRAGGTSPDIDTTSLCSDAQEFDVGLPDFGTTQIDYKFAPQTAIQQAVADYYSGDNKGEKMAVKVTLPNSGGVMVQLGRIQQQSEQAGNGTIWTGSIGIRNTGARADFAAA